MQRVALAHSHAYGRSPQTAHRLWWPGWQRSDECSINIATPPAKINKQQSWWLPSKAGLLLLGSGSLWPLWLAVSFVDVLLSFLCCKWQVPVFWSLKLQARDATPVMKKEWILSIIGLLEQQDLKLVWRLYTGPNLVLLRLAELMPKAVIYILPVNIGYEFLLLLVSLLMISFDVWNLKNCLWSWCCHP